MAEDKQYRGIPTHATPVDLNEHCFYASGPQPRKAQEVIDTAKGMFRNKNAKIRVPLPRRVSVAATQTQVSLPVPAPKPALPENSPIPANAIAEVARAVAKRITRQKKG